MLISHTYKILAKTHLHLRNKKKLITFRCFIHRMAKQTHWRKQNKCSKNIRERIFYAKISENNYHYLSIRYCSTYGRYRANAEHYHAGT